MAAVLSYVLRQTPTGAVLIFMSGVQEIRQTIDAIRQSPYSGSIEVLPLHANLTPEEQRLCFSHTVKQKIVVATNVAEVRYVKINQTTATDLVTPFRPLSPLTTLFVSLTVVSRKRCVTTQKHNYHGSSRHA